jgi:hypothetical protein
LLALLALILLQQLAANVQLFEQQHAQVIGAAQSRDQSTVPNCLFPTALDAEFSAVHLRA